MYCEGVVTEVPPGFLRLAGHPLRWRLAFCRVAAELRTRVGFLLARIARDAGG